ncbi:MAG: hypothetical protein R2839_02325 [Thermomicrobiales bacterium]
MPVATASFRREKFVPRGGPDGGDGGRGGDVAQGCSEHHQSGGVSVQPEVRRLRNGSAGASRNKHGRSAKTLTIKVPPGTIVWDDDTGELLADLTEPDETVTVAKGGEEVSAMPDSRPRHGRLRGSPKSANQAKNERFGWSCD